MLFSIDRSIFELFPHTRVALVIARGISQQTGAEFAREQLIAVQNNASQASITQGIEHHPTIKEWKKVYEEFGLDPKVYRSSVEALALRAVKKKVKSISPLVDCYNAVSIEFLMPMGGWDLAAIRGDILLTRAAGGEAVITLDGENSQAVAGEVIYRDQQGILCRGWNWRESRRVLLSSHTTDALFLIEEVSRTDDSALIAAAHTLALQLREWFGADTTIALSDSSVPAITIRRDAILITHEEPSPLAARTTTSSDRWALCDAISRERGGEYLVRSEKVASLKAEGIPVWADAPSITATTADLIKKFSSDEVTLPEQVVRR